MFLLAAENTTVLVNAGWRRGCGKDRELTAMALGWHDIFRGFRRTMSRVRKGPSNLFNNADNQSIFKI